MKKFLDNLENYIMAGGLFVMTFITVINVISRKFLGLSMSFLEEITTSMFILISLLGAAMAAKRGSNLGLSIFTDLIPEKYQKFVSLISWVAATFFSYYLVRFGLEMVKSEIKMGITTPSLGWPEWWFGMFLPIGGLFIFIRFTQFTVNMFRQKKEEE
ncbi:TRAP transporter small permease [Sedimentibacter sp. MB31-C6]|uniref:TRAP transporter small permease n=1 Tax=Sedimentibacter sp. MB31-C6 TaxID=3109366 RepID=UPI002DDD36F9|nr:TRAP transporter small permease [Sedimentibacter sp. MB36-C1]WSI03507.1 TRAP transporter small permease [Sedimentibacter sp. MB36-C1]